MDGTSKRCVNLANPSPSLHPQFFSLGTLTLLMHIGLCYVVVVVVVLPISLEMRPTHPTPAFGKQKA
eukprot:5446101-Amphidinium_carterae.1